MDFKEQMDEILFPRAERNEALKDALKTGNALLIDLALAIGASPLIGGKEEGEKLLIHAVKSGNLELVKKLVLVRHMGTASAMKAAVSNAQVEIAIWLLSQGAVMQIDRYSIVKNPAAVVELLAIPGVNAKIEYEALEAVITPKSGKPELLLRAMLQFLTEKSCKDLFKWMVNLADYLVDTDHVECFKVMMEFGLDLKYVNTKYCSAATKNFLEEHGITVLTF